MRLKSNSSLINGKVCPGLVRSDSAWRSVVRSGLARYGMARHGNGINKLKCGGKLQLNSGAFLMRHGGVGWGKARLGAAGFGTAWLGKTWQGKD